MPSPLPHTVRAPGRVNLLGEHIDYNDLDVLPMAIRRGVEIRFRPRDDAVVSLANEDPDFPPVSFEISPDIAPGDAGSWGNYVRAAARALAAEPEARSGARTGAGAGLQGIEGVVGSDLPVAAGLSSSSALVVAVARALLVRNGREVEPLALAALLAEGERFVGTAGGGMDQAVSLLGRDGHALRVGFRPLSVEPIPIPPDWRFLVASSLAPAEKSGEAQAAYNERTRSCAEALRVAAAAVRPDDPPASWRELLAAAPPLQLLEAARPAMDDITFRRFLHVVTEARRVDAGVAALRDDDRARFGSLMRASHGSLQTDYEVSTPALDELVSLALQAGADGARLTGAGFGGCALVLCRPEREERVMDVLRDGFYRTRGVEGDELSDLLFPVEPGKGAGELPPAG